MYLGMYLLVGLFLSASVFQGFLLETLLFSLLYSSQQQVKAVSDDLKIPLECHPDLRYVPAEKVTLGLQMMGSLQHL